MLTMDSSLRNRHPSGALRKASDLVQMTYPRESGDAYVLQLGTDADMAILLEEGGPLVFTLLDLCDGERSLDDILYELRRRFSGPEELWSRDVPDLARQLLAWRALEAMPPALQK